MKKTKIFQKCTVALLLLALLAAFAGCEKTPDAAGECALPGTRWDMTMEEYLKALNLQEGDYILGEKTPYDPETNTEGEQVILIENFQLFGAAADVYIRFADYNGSGKYYPGYTQVFYPDGTDMQAVKAAITKAYGKPAPAKNGMSEEYALHNVYWYGKTLRDDLIRPEVRALMPTDAVTKVMNENPVSHIGWSDQVWKIMLGDEDTWPTKQGLIFNSSWNSLMHYTPAG